MREEFFDLKKNQDTYILSRKAEIYLETLQSNTFLNIFSNITVTT